MPAIADSAILLVLDIIVLPCPFDRRTAFPVLRQHFEIHLPLGGKTSRLRCAGRRQSQLWARSLLSKSPPVGSGPFSLVHNALASRHRVGEISTAPPGTLSSAHRYAAAKGGTAIVVLFDRQLRHLRYMKQLIVLAQCAAKRHISRRNRHQQKRSSEFSF
jgi:hypothetical protein